MKHKPSGDVSHLLPSASTLACWLPLGSLWASCSGVICTAHMPNAKHICWPRAQSSDLGMLWLYAPAHCTGRTRGCLANPLGPMALVGFLGCHVELWSPSTSLPLPVALTGANAGLRSMSTSTIHCHMEKSECGIVPSKQAVKPLTRLRPPTLSIGSPAALSV